MERHQAEIVVQGLLDGHNLADLFPPVGSPAYVRRLRDQAAVAFYAAYTASPFESPYSKLDAAREAGEMVCALGYDPPGEPGKEG